MPTEQTPRQRMIGNERVRELTARWVVMGELRLESAALFGGDDAAATVDMPVQVDSEGRPRLTGSSLAGALRNHVNDLQLGFGLREEVGHLAQRIFGGSRSDDDGVQSPLIVFDSVGSIPEGLSIEVRDGVGIDPATGIAADTIKFDYEVLPTGTLFPIRFDLLVEKNDSEDEQAGILATALRALADGEIRLGARRSRGLGACAVINWRVKRFDLTSATGWLDWVSTDHHDPLPSVAIAADIQERFTTIRPTASGSTLCDERRMLVIDMDLHIPGGLLMRSPASGATSADSAPLAGLRMWHTCNPQGSLCCREVASPVRCEPARSALRIP